MLNVKPPLTTTTTAHSNAVHATSSQLRRI
jgi:hypothetical protein